MNVNINENLNMPFRTNGAIGALLDEYERAVSELKAVLADVSVPDLKQIIDHKTTDEDCRSIQTILSHVVSAGYAYVVYIRKWLNEDLEFVEKKSLDTVEEYGIALDKMFAYNVRLFEDYSDISIEEGDDAKKIHVRWGQSYDVEQLMEHAIVHILRHRRQIERFKLLL